MTTILTDISPSDLDDYEFQLPTKAGWLSHADAQTEIQKELGKTLTVDSELEARGIDFVIVRVRVSTILLTDTDADTDVADLIRAAERVWNNTDLLNSDDKDEFEAGVTSIIEKFSKIIGKHVHMHDGTTHEGGVGEDEGLLANGWHLLSPTLLLGGG